MTKIRLDEFLVNNQHAKTRSQAKQMILMGKVQVNGSKNQKPGKLIDPQINEIEIALEENYVGRGAYKLKKAIEKFEISVKNLVIADIGASTGGFTDLMLQLGAQKIYAIDVGSEQLAEKLVNDPRVVNLEKTNIRDPLDLQEKLDLAVIDLSYISLKLVLKNIFSLLKPNTFVVALFKPQFEAGKDLVPKDGVIKDSEVLDQIKKDFRTWCEDQNYEITDETSSPLKGKKGNQEFLIKLSSRS